MKTILDPAAYMPVVNTNIRQEAINRVCIDGHLNATLKAVMGSNEPDGVFCILGTLAAAAIDIALSLSPVVPVVEDEREDVIEYLKGIYGYLESTSPVGVADEAFRLPPSPTRTQIALFNSVSRNQPEKRAGFTRQDTQDRRANSGAVALSFAPKDGWISVEERLPEDDDTHLVYQTWREDRFRIQSAYFCPWESLREHTKGLWYCGYDQVPYPISHVTHWMPLPFALRRKNK